jgi:hypothetical protein
MKFKLMQIVLFLAAFTMAAVPVWSQDAVQPNEQPAPAEVQSAPSTAAGQDASSAVHIEDAAVCQDVVDRKPVGSSDTFVKETAKVFCFCRVMGAEPGTQITHNWYYNGALKASVKLHVGSTNYRTWSSKTMQPGWEGEWMVEVLSDDGKPLESIIFMVK